MSCDLTLGRLEPCKDAVAGLKAIYFINYDDDLVDNFTFTSDEITALTSPVTCFKYELKGANSFDEVNENSRENGTSFFAGTGTFVFKKQDLATQSELKLLSYGRPHVIIEGYDGQFRLAGMRNGCECQVDSVSGTNMGDLNGYNITMTSTEREMASYIDSTLMDNVAGFVVTVGT